MKIISTATRNIFWGIVLSYCLLASATSHAVVFQAENYDDAFDVTPGNEINVFRNGNVDIEVTTDVGGGFDVGWIDPTEWLLFNNFTAATTGNYIINFRVASPSGGGASVDLNSGAIPLGDFTIPATGGWQNWVTISRTVRINAGTYSLRVFAKTNGWNFNWIEVIPEAASSSSSKSSSSVSTSRSSSSTVTSSSKSSSSSSKSSSSSSSSASSRSSASSSSLAATAVDKSLFVHDLDTLQAADFSLRSTLQQLVNQFNALNPGNTTTVEQLYARMWDTQNPAPGIVVGGDKCTGTLNGFPAECRPQEGAQAGNVTFFIGGYTPLGLVNRFDLRDTVNFTDCGEYRIIYGFTANPSAGRNFIIFEAQIPNPKPGVASGCLPIAQFWQNLSAEPSAANRATALRNFYFNGIPAANVGPIIDMKNYSGDSGQIRTNMFMGTSWLLKEFKTDINAQGLSVIKPVSVKSNPVNVLFDALNNDTRAQAFRTDFVNNMDSLLGSFTTFSLTVANDAHNNGQSHANTPAEVENQFANSFFSGTNNAFRSAVANKLSVAGSNLSSTQVMNRATAMTCAGCHNPGEFGLSSVDAIGPGQSWPTTLGFTHISEFPNFGIFPISPALTDVFLPARQTDFRNYLLNTSSTTTNTLRAQAAPVSTLSVQPAAEPVKTQVKFGKRSG